MAFREAATFAEVAHDFDGEDDLAEFLRDQRAGAQSYEAVAYVLSSRTGNRISASTVRRWCLRLGIES